MGKPKKPILNKKAKILLAVINNASMLPEYFVKTLIRVFIFTRYNYPGTSLNFVSANSVNHMRNIACTLAIDQGFDYLIMLDTDHLYPEDMIIKLMAHDKDFVCGCANLRYPPFNPVQHKKYKEEGFKNEDNLIYLKGDEGLVEFGAGGVVGALIKVDILKKLKYPYFHIQYLNKESHKGGDVYFTDNLKKLGVKMYCDASLSYPHNVREMFTDRREIKHIF